MKIYRRILLLMLCMLVLAPAMARELRTIETTDTTIDLRVFTADGNKLLLGFPCDEGKSVAEERTAESLAKDGIEVWMPDMLSAYMLPRVKSSIHKIPDEAIAVLIEEALETAVHNEMDFGFLLSNFIGEFNGRNPKIMRHLNDILQIWEVNLISTIQKGKFDGYIDRHVDSEGVALYLMSSFIGIRTLMVETSPSARKYRFMAQLKQYFKSIESKNKAL